MKYFVYAYNHLTLLKGVSYAKNEWGIKNTYFIYTTLITEMPEGLKKNEFNSIAINPDKYLRKWKIRGLSTLDDLQANKKAVSIMADYIYSNVTNRDEEICLVIFRDTRIRESILINILKKKHLHFKVVMIEEGLGLYAKPTVIPHSSRTRIKELLYRLYGVPTISIYHLPHGMNPATNQIICSNPQALLDKGLDKKIEIVKQIDVYTKENADYFLNNILMEHVPQTVYDYVFLTQPIFPTTDDRINIKYNDFMRDIISIISSYGKMIIKPHPRDMWDYSQYEDVNVDVCPASYSKWAFEILASHWGNPQTITLYSSAACNSANSKPVIFLYNFFPELFDDNMFTSDFIINNGIVKCHNNIELTRALFKHIE